MSLKEQIFGKLQALILSPASKPQKALVLLHGFGSDEQSLLDVGWNVGNGRLIISLRASLIMGAHSFAWFHFEFTSQGPKHQWPESNFSFWIFQEALQDTSTQTGTLPENISVLGFSQCDIILIGLYMISNLHLENYFTASARNLSEFKDTDGSLPPDLIQRKVHVTHGTWDSRTPISMARTNEKIFQALNFDLTCREYSEYHEIPSDFMGDLKKWLETQ